MKDWRSRLKRYWAKRAALRNTLVMMFSFSEDEIASDLLHDAFFSRIKQLLQDNLLLRLQITWKSAIMRIAPHTLRRIAFPHELQILRIGKRKQFLAKLVSDSQEYYVAEQVSQNYLPDYSVETVKKLLFPSIVFVRCTLEYVENFLNNCNLYGYVPVLWDCNSAYDRDRCKMSSVELGRLFTKYSYEYERDLSREEVIKKSEEYLSTALEKATEVVTSDGTAWIMFSSSDWAVSYAVGDDHPTGGTDGIVTTEALITGEGTYTVGLDFSGTYAGSANSTVFAAIGILNGENLFPGYKITITQVLINGEEYKFSGENYTTSDNQICTRTNLYNGWVTSIPSAARTAGNLKNAPATGILDPAKLGSIKSIEITFTFTP